MGCEQGCIIALFHSLTGLVFRVSYGVVIELVGATGMKRLSLANWSVFKVYSIAFCAAAMLACIPVSTQAVEPESISRPSPAASKAPILDDKRLFALGMIETGNNDREIGGAGEVSRYQIHPVVWKNYSKSSDYANPEVALQVARAHWAYLVGYFEERSGREPDDFDMYVLWNTRFGYYAKKGFSAKQISPIVQERAQRFVNLVNRKG